MTLKTVLPKDNYSLPYPKILTDFEYQIDLQSLFRYTSNYWWVSIILSAIYLLFVFSGMKLMENRPPFKLKRPLFCWNLFLALFSIIGTYKSTPRLVGLVMERGYLGSVCFTDGHIIPSVGIWSYLFVFSKGWEFVDTGFLVLRKRDVIFLHWYHHITVFIFTCYLFKDEVALGHYFGVMNYWVHSIMYSYYAYVSSGRNVAGFISKFITRLQLAQMFAGLFHTFASFYALKSGTIPDCMFSERAFWVAMGIYGSYAVLFAQFYIKRYLNSKPRPKKE